MLSHIPLSGNAVGGMQGLRTRIVHTDFSGVGIVVVLDIDVVVHVIHVLLLLL